MGERDLTRRNVLASGAGAMLGAATMRWPAIADARRAPPPRLSPLSADVWALSLELEGTPAGAMLSAAGSPLPTSPHGNGYQAQLALGPGETTAVATNPEGGASTSAIYTGRVADRPTARVAVSVSGATVRLDASPSTPDPYTGASIASVSWRGRDGASLGSGSELALSGPFGDGEQYVVATVTDANGRGDEATVVFEVSGGQPAAVELGSWQPQWVQQAVVYGAIPPLFGAPPLEAVTAALDRLAALGVNVLWLAPLFECEEGDFGYAVTDYFSVRSDYGDLAALQALVSAAHTRGIKVILDLPINDTSFRHPYYEQSLAGETSHYYDFYARNAAGKATRYFNWRNLPNLNYSSAEVRLMATEAAAYWVRVADVDGFRCDAAWGIEERAPGFWTQWREELQRIRPDLLLLAEASARESWPSAEGFSAAYDWTEELGVAAWERAFAPRKKVTARLTAAISAEDRSRPFRFLENNDTGTRFVTRYGPQMTRAAAAMLMTLPGIPCIYTGQEIGAEYHPYKRQTPLDWSEDPHELEAYYSGLIAERMAEPALALAAASVELLRATPATKVLAYAVSNADAALLVAVNFSGQDVSAVIDAGADWGGTLPVEVPAWSAVKVAPA